MLRTKHYVLILLALSLTVSLEAQNRFLGVKIYPGSLIFGKTALQAELMISPNKSLTFDYSNRDVDVTKGIVGNFIKNTVDQETTGNFKSLQLNAAIRLYSKKKEGPKGLYFAFGGRFTRAESDLVIEIENYPNTQVSMNTKMFGGQIDMGVQWMIANRIAIDWNFLGLGFQTGILEGDGISPDLDPADAQDFADGVNDVIDQIPFVNLEFIAKENTVSASGNQFLPFLRSRIAVGIFF